MPGQTLGSDRNAAFEWNRLLTEADRCQQQESSRSSE